MTVFSIRDDFCQFKCLTFTVVNWPPTFNLWVSTVLQGLPWDHSQAYEDDILAGFTSFDDHFQNLGKVFLHLSEHGLKFNAGKCELFRAEVNYLDHVVGHRVKPLLSNVTAILNIPVPKDDCEAAMKF